MIENPLLILNQYGVAITPDEKYLYIVNNQYYGITPYDSVYVYNLINEQFVAKITHASFKTPSTATISGRRVYITNSNSTTISIIDAFAQIKELTLTIKGLLQNMLFGNFSVFLINASK